MNELERFFKKIFSLVIALALVFSFPRFILRQTFVKIFFLEIFC